MNNGDFLTFDLKKMSICQLLLSNLHVRLFNNHLLSFEKLSFFLEFRLELKIKLLSNEAQVFSSFPIDLFFIFRRH